MPIYIWLKDLSTEKQLEVLTEYGDGYGIEDRPIVELPTKKEVNNQLESYLLELQRDTYLSNIFGGNK